MRFKKNENDFSDVNIFTVDEGRRRGRTVEGKQANMTREAKRFFHFQPQGSLYTENTENVKNNLHFPSITNIKFRHV